MASGAVLWDFDGTLAARAGMWRGALIEALSEAEPGHDLTHDDLRPGLRDGFPWHSPEVGHTALRTADAWWAALLPVFAGAYEHAGVRPEVATRAGQLVRGRYIDTARWTVFPDSVAVLTQLREAGWRHFLVSNHVPELDDLLRDLGLARLFAGVVNSARLGWEKPNRRIFEAALQLAGRPERVWMVGDNPRADIGGASAAGIPGILVGPDGCGLSTAAERILVP